jgi:hypothetical protein
MHFNWGQEKSRMFQIMPLGTFSMALTIDILRRLSDPLIHYGRHFGRTVHALCSVKALITNGLLRIGERASDPDESFTWEYVFQF